MEASDVDIYIEYPENNQKKTYVMKCPRKISYLDFKKLIGKHIQSINKMIYYIIFKDKKYNKDNYRDILKFENGDKVTIVDNAIREAFHAKFHLDPKLNEGDMKTGKLTGILKLILIKYISNCINNINLISSQEIRDIICELQKGIKLEEDPQKDVKSNLTNNDGGNILAYTNYVCSVINDQEINNLLNFIEPNLKQHAIKYWSILSKYEEFNTNFEENLNTAIKNSYFDYSLINLSIFEQANKERYLSVMKRCENLVRKYLFHGSQVEHVSSIVTSGFLYARKPFYGMGTYFTDMLDYVAFYCGGTNYQNRRDNFGIIPTVNSTFSCVGAEVFYNKSMLKKVYDFSYFVNELDHFPTYEEIKRNYKDKMIPLYGVNYARIEPNYGRVRNQNNIIQDKKEGRFLGTEYVITEKDQILPLYGLTFKRNEYFIIWRDPNFGNESQYSKFLKYQKLFVYKYAKMNIYFETNTESALEIVKKKRFNKIILITSIGLDLSGLKFVEVARGILGFDAVVLFFSQNKDYLKYIQKIPNSLYTDNMAFFQEYIMNYNKEGLYRLKNKIEQQYKINLNFTANYLQFPKFINQNEYKNIIFREPNPFFKKVIIKNSENGSIFYMNENRNVSFGFIQKIDNSNVNLYLWYITMVRNEITLYSRGNYLGGNLQQRTALGDKYMQRYNFGKINNNEYIIYYQNQNNILTMYGNYATLQNPNPNWNNQRFQFFELAE